MFAKLFKKNPEREAAEKLYDAVVGQARQPVFYQDWDVPDTLDGRFDLIILHVFLVMRCLKDQGETAASLSQQLQEIFITDMDRSLREIGVGDMSIGKHVKKMASALFGRLEVYDRILDTGGSQNLRAALHRNIYREQDPGTESLDAINDYVLSQARYLESQPLSGFLSGQVNFRMMDDEKE